MILICKLKKYDKNMIEIISKQNYWKKSQEGG